MSYVDAQAVVARFQSVGSSLTSLGQQMAQSGPSGDFGATLAEIGAELSGAPTAAATATAPATSAYLPTTSLLGLSSSSAVDPSDLSSSPLVSADAASPGSSAAAPVSGGAAVVASASTYIGVPYVWGGTSPSGFDCSGLVQYVYGQLGVSLPRTSEEQATVGTPVASLAQAQPGDLVFFAGSDGTASSPGHVGIYIGNGQMIDAPHTGTTVQVQPVGTPTEIRRVLPSEGATAGGSGSIAAGLGVPSDLAALFTSIGQSTGVSPTLLAAVAKQESGFQTDAVSGAGAEGLMQLMPSTAAGLGVNPLDPAQAITGAATLLKGYLAQFGSVPLALAAYNAGPGAVTSNGGIPPYAETQNYVSSITSMLGEAA